MSAMPVSRWREFHGTAFEGARVLVTGGAGFIGSHLSEALSTLGASVVVLDSLEGGSTENLSSFRISQFIEGSILDEQILSRCARGCEFVFHQAALGSVPRSVEQPRRYQEVNATGTLNVLEASRAAGVRRVMFAASSSAYGDPVEPGAKSETIAPAPRSPYAATKVAGEALLAAYSACYEIDAVSLRYFNIFGPRQNANSAYAAVIAAFARAILSGQRPVIFGDGDQSRDFTYVANAVHANLLAARRDKPLDGSAINVACGQSVSVNQLAAAMARLLGCDTLKPVYEPVRQGDVKHSLADLARARRLLGYEPVVGFEEGLAATVAWYREQKR